MKLYRYYQDYGRMGAIEGLLIMTDEQKERYSNHELWWDELLGKHSEGYYVFSDETLTELNLPYDIVEILFYELGPVVSGPFDFDYFEEQIEEQAEHSEEDYEEDD